MKRHSSCHYIQLLPVNKLIYLNECETIKFSICQQFNSSNTYLSQNTFNSVNNCTLNRILH